MEKIERGLFSSTADRVFRGQNVLSRKSERDWGENVFRVQPALRLTKRAPRPESAAWLDFHVQSTVQLFLYDKSFLCPESVI